ncbi:MAG: hypothetical protein LBH77_03790 [Tannerella sp.]|jgi:hypothetical protein|nr:hypothetical protein [Tannerella sp.]
MPDNKLENKIRKHAGEIFGKDVELPFGHRDRFEQRLKEFNHTAQPKIPEDTAFAENAVSVSRPEMAQKPGKAVSLKRRLIASVAVAAVIAGFVFLLTPSAGNNPPEDRELADIRGYYNIRLEEQADATRQLIQQVDEAHREVLLADIEQIENVPIPDVQITDDEYIVLIAEVYTRKIEALQSLQNVIRENI